MLPFGIAAIDGYKPLGHREIRPVTLHCLAKLALPPQNIANLAVCHREITPPYSILRIDGAQSVANAKGRAIGRQRLVYLALIGHHVTDPAARNLEVTLPIHLTAIV